MKSMLIFSNKVGRSRNCYRTISKNIVKTKKIIGLFLKKIDINNNNNNNNNNLVKVEKIEDKDKKKTKKHNNN